MAAPRAVADQQGPGGGDPPRDGRLAGLVAVAGTGLIALPTGMLAAAFSDALQRERRRAADPKQSLNLFALTSIRLQLRWLMKAFLIALAVLVGFDAAVWGGSVRREIVREFMIAAHEVGALSWNWA